MYKSTPCITEISSSHHSNLISQSLHLNTSCEDDIRNVAEKTEKILRVLTYSILEAMMHEEEADGDFLLSTIPLSIINELRMTRMHFLNADNTDGNNLDKYILANVVKVLQNQLEDTAKHYHKLFHNLVAELDITDGFELAYEKFVKVCRKILMGNVSWGAIASLVCFGAEVAVWVIRSGRPGVEAYLKKIVHYVVEFFVKEEIAHWIATHGGWMAMVEVLDSPGCKDHANHILSVMAITELTHIDVWFSRLMKIVFVAGVCYSIVRFVR